MTDNAVNRYIVTMTTWSPSLDSYSGPRYLAIADALAADIAAGDLSPGDRLPTHRDLAWRLGVTVGTVSRAYAEAARRGLVSGEVGRGTYVRGPLASGPHFDVGRDDGDAPLIDLGVAMPAPGVVEPLIAPTLQALAKDPAIAALIGYQPAAGRPEHRAAGAAWLARRGLHVSPDQVVVTNGGNHGMNLALAATTRPGDRILTGDLSYAQIQPMAAMLGLRLEGVASDAQGMIPEAVDAACRANKVKALYCIPTLQNPTTTVMPEARRRAIAEVAERHDLAILEDDIFALLLESPPPTICSFAPERGYCITSLSKTLAPGLRVGYVAAPAQAVERLASALRATCMMASPIPAEMATRWIRDGIAERILAEHQREALARRERALEILGAWKLDCPPGSVNLWLHLPEPWRGADFAAAARRRGVMVAPAEAFAVGPRQIPRAVRIGLGPPRDRAVLERALRLLADLLREGPTDSFGSIV